MRHCAALHCAALRCTALRCSVGSAFLAVEEGGPAPPEGSLAGFVGAPGTSTALIDNSADVRRAKYAVDAADYKQTLLRQMEVRFTVSFVWCLLRCAVGSCSLWHRSTALDE